MERDEIYVPYTRSSFNLPQEDSATASDYEEILAETPFVITTRMLIMQFLYVFFTYARSTVYILREVAGGHI